MVSCCDCGQRFSCPEDLEVHIASDHLNFFPYECEKCRFAKFPTEFALIYHSRHEHGLKEFVIKYRYSDEIRRKMTELKLKLHMSMSKSNNEASSSAPSLPTGDNGDRVEEEDGYSSPADAACSSGGDHQPSTPVNLPSTSTGTDSHTVTASMNNFFSQAEAKPNPTFFNSGCGMNELSPLDFAPEAFAPGGMGMEFATMVTSEDVQKKPRDAVTCQICGLQVSNQRSSLVYHANTKHIKLNLYQCNICHKTWQTIAKSDVLKHVKAIHDGDESMIIDNRKRFNQKLKVFVSRCFPAKDKSTSRFKTISHGSSSMTHPENGLSYSSLSMNDDPAHILQWMTNARKSESNQDNHDFEDDTNGDMLDDGDNDEAD